MTDNERTAEDWGRIAVSLPGWRWMPGTLARHGNAWSVRTVERKRTGGVRLDGGGDTGAGCWPNPDDPATAGCLLALLGTDRVVTVVWQFGMWQVFWNGSQRACQPTLGRACIAAAEAIGYWPGGSQ